MRRLTKSVLQQILDQNEGFTFETSHRGRNQSEDRRYRISDGQLHYTAAGRGSWADSRYSHGWAVADDEQTRRFVRTYADRLNTDGLG